MFNMFRNQRCGLVVLVSFVCFKFSRTEPPRCFSPILRSKHKNWSYFQSFRFDVLPVIPVFNLLNAIGVPFVDKTVTVSTLSKAIVAALEDETVAGVQRFPEMEELEKAIG